MLRAELKEIRDWLSLARLQHPLDFPQEKAVEYIDKLLDEVDDLREAINEVRDRCSNA